MYFISFIASAVQESIVIFYVMHFFFKKDKLLFGIFFYDLILSLYVVRVPKSNRCEWRAFIELLFIFYKFLKLEKCISKKHFFNYLIKMWNIEAHHNISYQLWCVKLKASCVESYVWTYIYALRTWAHSLPECIYICPSYVNSCFTRAVVPMELIQKISWFIDMRTMLELITKKYAGFPGVHKISSFPYLLNPIY